MEFSTAFVQVLSTTNVVNLLDTITILVVILVKIEPYHFCFPALCPYDHQPLLRALEIYTLLLARK